MLKPHAGQRPETLVTALRREVGKVDPNLPLYFVGTPKQNLDGMVAANRVIAAMFSIFGVVAVVLAAVGIYGVMSFSVSQRTQEFGVRMALGAAAGDLLRLVIREGLVMTGIGVAAGLALALAATRPLASFLYGVSPFDPAVFLGVPLLLTGVSVLACWLPARRATKVNPIEALRAE